VQVGEARGCRGRLPAAPPGHDRPAPEPQLLHHRRARAPRRAGGRHRAAPIDDHRLDVRPVVRDELLYVSADPQRTRRPATIERLASAPLIFYDAESADSDPIRRLLAERAQAHGLRLRPRVEVEMAEMALSLVARRLGDTYLPVSYTHAPYYPAGLTTTTFTPALFNTFAIITRPAARLAPGTRELLTELETHMQATADAFDRSR
jgi:LysR substrate binding domain-containing protein